jgi:hypothetical protein
MLCGTAFVLLIAIAVIVVALASGNEEESLPPPTQASAANTDGLGWSHDRIQDNYSAKRGWKWRVGDVNSLIGSHPGSPGLHVTTAGAPSNITHFFITTERYLLDTLETQLGNDLLSATLVADIANADPNTTAAWLRFCREKVSETDFEQNSFKLNARSATLSYFEMRANGGSVVVVSVEFRKD